MTDKELVRLRAISDAAYSLVDAVEDRLCDYEGPVDPEAAFQRLLALRWQSMDSAPRDGTRFLAMCDAWQGEINGIEERDFMAVTGGKPGASDRDGAAVWWPGDGDAYAVWLRATAWMPLPPVKEVV